MRRTIPHTYTQAILFQNGSIGDFLMAIFLARNMYAKATQRVIIIVPRGAQFLRGFAAAYPFISVVEVSHNRISSVATLFGLIRSHALVVLPPTIGALPLRLKITAWICAQGKGSFLIGFKDSGSLCATLFDRVLHYDTDRPFIETLNQTLALVGIAAPTEAPTIACEGDPEALVQYKLSGKRYVFFHPRGSSEKRSFEKNEVVRLVSTLLHADPLLMVVISGSKAESDWVHDVARQTEDPSRVVVVCGAGANALCALIHNAALFIGVDTGITHLACFLKVRVLVAAHKGTANWLPFYHPGARILYRLQEDTVVHEDLEYLQAQRKGRIKPFGNVPVEAIERVALEMLA